MREAEQIAVKLERFCRQTEERNGRGMLDLTRQGEDIVCRLLNLAFGWELVNLNRLRPNCPAVDLVDDARGICVQVTGARGMGKALETRRLLRRHYGGTYRRLLVFYLLGKPKKPQLSDEPGIRTELWDMEDLAAALADAPQQVRREALAFLLAMEDSGILERQPDLSEPAREFVPSREVLETGDAGQTLLVCQERRVRLLAYLPRSPEKRLSCKLEFARRDTLGSHITFSQRELTETLFPGHHGPLEQRRFTAALDRQRDFAAMQMGNCRYFTDVDTAEQTARVLDALQEEYAAGQAELAQLLGTAAFTVPPEEDWAQPLCRMPAWLWEELLRDAERRENLDGVELRVRDRQAVCLLRTERPWGTAAELRSRAEGDACLLLWHRGAVCGLTQWEGFDRGFQWRADRTLDWLLERWLPEAAQGLYDRRYPRGAAGRLLRRLGCIPDREWFQAQLLARTEPLLRAHDGPHRKNDTFP